MKFIFNRKEANGFFHMIIMLQLQNNMLYKMKYLGIWFTIWKDIFKEVILDNIILCSHYPGKTVAFMLPILERLMYRTQEEAATRVLVLVPTRELAVQVHTVARQLAQYTNIEIVLSAGT